jgi:hypothetical protein
LKLERQSSDAAAWRDRILGYFQQFSQRPLPDGPDGPGPARTTRQAPPERRDEGA